MPASVPWSLRIWLVVVGVYCSLMFLTPWQASTFSGGGSQPSRRIQVESESSAVTKHTSSAQPSLSKPLIKTSRGSSPVAIDEANFAHPQ
jgi:hypothetical protein